MGNRISRACPNCGVPLRVLAGAGQVKSGGYVIPIFECPLCAETYGPALSPFGRSVRLLADSKECLRVADTRKRRDDG